MGRCGRHHPQTLTGRHPHRRGASCAGGPPTSRLLNGTFLPQSPTNQLAPMPAWSSVFRPNLFESKVAIVSGGGTGIGLAVTRELLGLGCEVFICSRSAEKLEAAVEAVSPASRSRLHTKVALSP